MLENELKKEEKRVRTIMQRFLIAHICHLKILANEDNQNLLHCELHTVTVYHSSS